MQNNDSLQTTLSSSSKESSANSSGDRIIRSPHNRENPYTITSRALLDNDNLSPDCRFFLTRLLAKPVDWEIHVSQLATEYASWWSKKKIYKLINEAISHGYMKREDQFFRGLKRHCIYFVSEFPEFLEINSKIPTVCPKTACRKRAHITNIESCNTNKIKNTERACAPPVDQRSIEKESLESKNCQKERDWQPPDKQSPGVRQLPRSMTKGSPPTPGSAKMVEDTEQIISQPIQVGSQKFLIHQDDRKWFHGFSPYVVEQGLLRVNRLSLKGVKIRDITAKIFFECTEYRREADG